MPQSGGREAAAKRSIWVTPFGLCPLSKQLFPFLGESKSKEALLAALSGSEGESDKGIKKVS